MKPLPDIPLHVMRFTDVVHPGANWSHVLKRGTTLRLSDPQGGLNVSLLAFNADNLTERLNLPDTLKAQHTGKLAFGDCLYSDMGRILLSITADNLYWHDPLTGHSTAATVEAAFGKKSYQEAHNAFHRNARNGFLQELGKYGLGLRDLVMNVNFFSKVAVEEDGRFEYHPGHAVPGGGVELRAEMNTLVVLNTCPHPLAPGPDYPAAPLEIYVYNSPPPGHDNVFAAILIIGIIGFLTDRLLDDLRLAVFPWKSQGKRSLFFRFLRRKTPPAAVEAV